MSDLAYKIAIVVFLVLGVGCIFMAFATFIFREEISFYYLNKPKPPVCVYVEQKP